MRSRHLKLFRNSLRGIALALALAGLVLVASKGAGAPAITAFASSLIAFALSHFFHRRYRQRMGKRAMINVF